MNQTTSAIISQIKPINPTRPTPSRRIRKTHTPRLTFTRNLKQKSQIRSTSSAIQHGFLTRCHRCRRPEIRTLGRAPAPLGEIRRVRVRFGDGIGESVHVQLRVAAAADGVIGRDGDGDLAPVGSRGDSCEGD